MKRNSSRAIDVLFALCAAGFAVWILNVSGCNAFPVETTLSLPKELEQARVALIAGNLKEAERQFDLAIQKDPSNPATYTMIAGLCSSPGCPLGEYGRKTAKRGLAATEKAPRSERARLYDALGTMFVNQGGPDAAEGIRYYREARKLDPAHHQYMNDLGYGLAETQGDDKEALAEALSLTRSAVELARKEGVPEKTLGLYVDSLGWVLYKMGKSEEALPHLIQASTLAEDHWEIHYHTAKAYEATGKLNEAYQSLRRASLLNPTNASLSRALEALGKKVSKKPVELSSDSSTSPESDSSPPETQRN